MNISKEKSKQPCSWIIGTHSFPTILDNQTSFTDLSSTLEKAKEKNQKVNDSKSKIIKK